MNTRAQSQIWFLQSHINALVVSPKHALKSNHVHCEWGQCSLESLSAEHYLSSIKLWKQSYAAFFHWHLFDLDADSLINKTSTFCHHQSEGSHFASQPVLLMLIRERGCAYFFFFFFLNLVFDLLYSHTCHFKLGCFPSLFFHLSWLLSNQNHIPVVIFTEVKRSGLTHIFGLILMYIALRCTFSLLVLTMWVAFVAFSKKILLNAVLFLYMKNTPPPLISAI